MAKRIYNNAQIPVYLKPKIAKEPCICEDGKARFMIYWTNIKNEKEFCFV